MRNLLRGEFEAMRAEPVERLMKPAIKAVVLIGIISTVALYLTENYDRKGLAKLSGEIQVSAKPPQRR